MDAADQVADLLERRLRLLVGLGDQRRAALGVGLEALAGHAEVHGEGDEALLGAVVEVALDAPALGLGAVDGRGPAGLGATDLLAQLVAAAGTEQPAGRSHVEAAEHHA